MSERIVQTVTPRQLRREFNGIGLTFLIVFGLAVGAAFGYRWLTPLLEPYYQTVDRQAAEMGIRIVVTLLVMLLPFQIYAALKKMKTGRFFGHCQGEWRDILGLVLIGLALNLLLTFIVGILALVLSWSNIQFTSSELILQGKLPAVVTMRFNSILPPLLIHIAINLQTVALQQVPVQYSWIIGLSCVVIYALALFALIRGRHKRIIVRKEANPWILIQQFFLSWAIVITLAVYGVLNILTIKM